MDTNEWTKVLIDEPVKVILSMYRRKKCNLIAAAHGIECCYGLAQEMYADANLPSSDLKTKVDNHLSKGVLDALVGCRGGYETLSKISEHSPAMKNLLEHVEKEFGGNRITLKRITDPERAEVADKLIKSRAIYLKKQQNKA